MRGKSIRMGPLTIIFYLPQYMESPPIAEDAKPIWYPGSLGIVYWPKKGRAWGGYLMFLPPRIGWTPNFRGDIAPRQWPHYHKRDDSQGESVASYTYIDESGQRHTRWGKVDR